jgi:hypothetical protein
MSVEPVESSRYVHAPLFGSFAYLISELKVQQCGAPCVKSMSEQEALLGTRLHRTPLKFEYSCLRQNQFE